jgi:hypothetical protein
MFHCGIAVKYKRRTVIVLFAFYQIPKKFNDWLSPSKAKSLIKRKTKMAMIGEKSIGPSGGMNFLKKLKYGSTILVIHSPTLEA